MLICYAMQREGSPCSFAAGLVSWLENAEWFCGGLMWARSNHNMRYSNIREADISGVFGQQPKHIITTFCGLQLSEKNS